MGDQEKEDRVKTSKVDRQSGLLWGLGSNVPPGRDPPATSKLPSIVHLQLVIRLVRPSVFYRHLLYSLLPVAY